MRGLIIDYARRRRAHKRGGQFVLTGLDTNKAAVVDATDLSGMSDALDALAAIAPRVARVVDLKFFCGFTFAETAAVLGVTERTVQRDWEKARIYLYRTLRGGSASI
jgi:RNA polymerase sigma factor (TIGR02999 family)